MFKFEKLDVWKFALDLSDELLKFADTIPRQDQFSLGEQLRRAAISIPTNIAEGSGRNPGRDSKIFFNYAKGSTYEVVNLLMICKKRVYIQEPLFSSFTNKAEIIARMLTGLIRKPVVL